MLISVLGFGSIWTLRSTGVARAQKQFDTRELAYYNTTGVEVGGKLRNRPRVYGVARFNGNSGFRPECWHRMLYKVFDSGGMLKGPAGSSVHRELASELS